MSELALKDTAPVAQMDATIANLVFTPTALAAMVSVADLMASGRATVPKHLHGNKGDCLAVVMQAMQWGMNPFAVAQKTHLINGALGYEGQLVIAVINNSPLVVGRLEYEWFGPWEKIIGKFKAVESKTKKDDDGFAKKYIVPDWDIKDEAGLGIIVRATLKGESAPRELTLLMTQCRTRNSGLWTEDPKQQIAYLASRRWGRLHTPDVMLGVYTREELEEQSAPKDMGNADIVDGSGNTQGGGNGSNATGAAKGLSDAELAAWRAESAKGMTAAKAHWAAMGKELRGKATHEQQTAMRVLAERADKERTVDNSAADAKAASTASAEASPPATATATASAAADPATGVVEDDFVAAMSRAEKAAEGAK